MSFAAELHGIKVAEKCPVQERPKVITAIIGAINATSLESQGVTQQPEASATTPTKKGRAAGKSATAIPTAPGFFQELCTNAGYDITAGMTDKQFVASLTDTANLAETAWAAGWFKGLAPDGKMSMENLAMVDTLPEDGLDWLTEISSFNFKSKKQ